LSYGLWLMFAIKDEADDGEKEFEAILKRSLETETN
jgi:hypothetical protein